MFNWHDLDESFLKWMVVNLTVDTTTNDSGKLFDELSKATKGFTEVEMKISINGVDVPIDYFVKSVKNNMDFIAKKEAGKLVLDYDPLNTFREAAGKIEDDLNEVRHVLRFRLNKLLNELDIELPDYDD